MKQAWETVIAYKLIWLRVVGYVITPVIVTFLSISQQIDIDVKWPTMGPFSRASFWLGIASPGISALMAFLDKSLARKEDEVKATRSGETQLFIKNNPSSGI